MLLTNRGVVEVETKKHGVALSGANWSVPVAFCTIFRVRFSWRVEGKAGAFLAFNKGRHFEASQGQTNNFNSLDASSTPPTERSAPSYRYDKTKNGKNRYLVKKRKGRCKRVRGRLASRRKIISGHSYLI